MTTTYMASGRIAVQMRKGNRRIITLNIEGIGILVPFENEPGENEKVKKLDDRARIHIAQNLLDAAEFIAAREK